ncbi:MAG TPA: pirin-like C-terminal cupin domain-containing protein, partial [Xanthomonadales bacterium]|nr:pirin-like C-terminal cupin domain-containing protein [Xanthomonadales bacterium]
LDNGGSLKLIAGRVELDGKSYSGPINPTPGSMATDPLYVDLSLPAGATQELAVPQGHNAFVYAYEGSAEIAGQALPHQAAGILSNGNGVEIKAGNEDLRLVLIAGKPLGEPVVQYGPFVMNTREEIEQALADYRQGVLTG